MYNVSGDLVKIRQAYCWMAKRLRNCLWTYTNFAVSQRVDKICR